MGKGMIVAALPGAAAYEIRNLLEDALPHLNTEEPPIIRDTMFDEEGIYFSDMPPVVKKELDVFILTVQGSVWTWDGTNYRPAGHDTDMLDIELLPCTQGTEIKIVPRWGIKAGFVEHIRTLIYGLFSEPTPQVDAQVKPTANGETQTGGGKPATESEPAPTQNVQNAESGATDGEQTEKRELPETTKRRRERVRNLWRAGKSDKEIAEELSISESTVYRDRRVQGLVSKKKKS